MKKRTDKKFKEKTHAETKLTLRRKRIIAVVSVVIALALLTWMGFYITDSLFAMRGQGLGKAAKHFSDKIKSFGNAGILVAFGIQVLQVVVSPIPGEAIEIGMGLCFGWFWGSIICLLGAALAAWIILLFVRKYGYKLVELFVPIEKINELKFINNEKKLTNSVFWLYIIPGVPKDPLIFFFGLTKISITDFVVISTIARIPSVVSSAIGGDFIVKENYMGAVIVFAITAATSIAGLLIYKSVLKKIKERKHKEE